MAGTALPAGVAIAGHRASSALSGENYGQVVLVAHLARDRDRDRAVIVADLVAAATAGTRGNRASAGADTRVT